VIDKRLEEGLVMFRTLYFLFFVLFPFYLFSSGQPQISHLILVVIYALVIFSMFTQFFNVVNQNLIFLLFLIYVVFVNTIWLIVTYKMSFAVNSLFYVFNILLFYSTYLLYIKGDIDANLIRNSILASLLIQFFLLLQSGLDFSQRQMLFFNNPNQLGYYAIASLNIYFILGVNEVKNRDLVETIKSILVYLLSFILLVFSSSKAALASYFLIISYILYIEFVERVNLSKLLMASIGLVAILFFISSNMDTIDKIVEHTELFNRTVHAGQESDDSLAGRGYDRITLYSQYLFLGAGEGYFDRFILSHHHGELHSTPANILFSYGVIGSLLFLIFFTNFFDFYISKVLFFMSPVLLYGLTHNGIRSPLFWIALALSLIYSKKENRCTTYQKN